MPIYQDQPAIIEMYLNKFRSAAAASGYKPKWVWHQMRLRYGDAIADQYAMIEKNSTLNSSDPKAPRRR